MTVSPGDLFIVSCLCYMYDALTLSDRLMQQGDMFLVTELIDNSSYVRALRFSPVKRCVESFKFGTYQFDNLAKLNRLRKLS